MIAFFKKYIIEILVAFGLSFVLYVFFHKRDPYKECRKKFEALIEFGANGKVVGKYIDEKNHEFPMIQVENINGTRIRINLTLDKSNLYDSLEVGYFFKKYNGDSLVYYGTNSLDKVHEINFNCRSWQ